MQQGRDIVEVCKEQINKLKLHDLLVKAIDKVVVLSSKNEDFLALNSDLFARIAKSSE